MSTGYLATSTIEGIFTDEMEDQSGDVTDTFNDGVRLFMRSVLPQSDLVKRQDCVQAGVALKATLQDVCIYPYVLREVCSNGFILARSLQAKRIVFAELDAPELAEDVLHESIVACCRPETFNNFVRAVRSSANEEIDHALTILSWMALLRARFSHAVTGQILSRFIAENDRSRFGLLNAVTSTARDSSDPEQRWRLEEFGGEIAVSRTPKPPHDTLGEYVSRHEPLAVGNGGGC